MKTKKTEKQTEEPNTGKGIGMEANTDIVKLSIKKKSKSEIRN